MVGLLPLCRYNDCRTVAAGAGSGPSKTCAVSGLQRMPALCESIHPTGPDHLGVGERGIALRW